MFEDYLEDAEAFFTLAGSNISERQAKRYYRASVFCTAGAIEAFINYIADGFAKGNALPEFESAFLNDEVLFFNLKTGKKATKKEFHRLEEKLKVLLKRFTPELDLSHEPSWSKVLEFKKLRDNLTHPKQDEDTLSVVEYRKCLKAGISGVIELMNILSTGIYKRPLRQKLLDLIPE